MRKRAIAVNADNPDSVKAMRVLALADEPPHGRIDELVAASRPELIVLLGDLEPAWTDGLADVELPKLGVLGNHDASDALSAVGAEEIHLRRVELGGLSFSGFGGSPRYSRHGANEWTEEEAAELVERLPAADVLLTHSPPAGVNDEPDDPAHRGSPALREWVERERPAWLLHGHTLPHPVQRVERLGDTRVVHVRGAMALELSP
ncbi:MAG: metallophosphoesterase family protein [Thermoleophilaceae bacterium]